MKKSTRRALETCNGASVRHNGQAFSFSRQLFARELTRPKTLVHLFFRLGARYSTAFQGQDKDSLSHLTMADAGGSDRLTYQNDNLPPGEQTQPPQHSPRHIYDATKAILCSSYVNILLVFVPIGITAGALRWTEVAVFFLNMLAIIPLAPVIAFSTKELSASIGKAPGALLKTALRNAVEMIVRHLCLSLVLYSAFFV